MEYTEIDATDIACWNAPHAVREAGKVARLIESMTDGESFIWSGPALVADIEACTLYTGTHRQQAIVELAANHDVSCWGIPVIDIRDLIDYDAVIAECEAGADFEQALFAAVGELDRDTINAIGWDRD